MWSQALSVTWSCSAIAGPLLGGVFSTSGRKSFLFFIWKMSGKIHLVLLHKNKILVLLAGDGDVSPELSTFFLAMSQSSSVFINLPICFVSLVVIATSLRGVQMKQASDVSWLTLAQKFDFLGL